MENDGAACGRPDGKSIACRDTDEATGTGNNTSTDTKTNGSIPCGDASCGDASCGDASCGDASCGDSRDTPCCYRTTATTATTTATATSSASAEQWRAVTAKL